MQRQHLLELEMSYYDDDIAVIETGISISNQELVLPFLLLNESWCRPYQIDARDKLTQKIENVARSFFFLFVSRFVVFFALLGGGFEVGDQIRALVLLL